MKQTIRREEKYVKKVTDIIWDTDGDEEALESLPTETEVPDEVDDDDVADYLSDKYGYLVDALLIEEA